MRLQQIHTDSWFYFEMIAFQTIIKEVATIQVNILDPTVQLDIWHEDLLD